MCNLENCKIDNCACLQKHDQTNILILSPYCKIYSTCKYNVITIDLNESKLPDNES